MKYLLDTCAFLWFMEDSSVLTAAARKAIIDPANEVYLSAVSGWEIGRKYARGDLQLPKRPEVLLPEMRERTNILSLPLSELEAISAEKLPLIHKDPFDRMLISQAMLNGMTLISSDEVFGGYTVSLLW